MMKGVNLGNWLVLEKWMSPELFDGTSAEDEVHLWRELSETAARERFKVHRDSWVHERDFVYLAANGIELIRIPVPFFIFGDVAPYVGCIEYLDEAFEWAQRHGQKILIDLHTVPGSQNGFDNGSPRPRGHRRLPRRLPDRGVEGLLHRPAFRERRPRHAPLPDDAHDAAGDRELDEYLAFIADRFAGTVREAARDVPVMIGEWCLDTASKKPLELTDDERRSYFRKIADAQLRAWEPAVAWTYWSYKLHTKDPQHDPWDMGRAIELRWLPEELAPPAG